MKAAYAVKSTEPLLSVLVCDSLPWVAGVWGLGSVVHVSYTDRLRCCWMTFTLTPAVYYKLVELARGIRSRAVS